MILSPEDAQLFFKLHRSLMCYVNQRLGVVEGVSNPDEFSALPPQARWGVLDAFLDEPDLIETFVDDNPFHLPEEELDIVHSWRHHVFGKFVLFRQLKKHMIFLSTDAPPVAYGVLGLTETFEEILGPRLPIMIDTMLLPFKGCIVYDGLFSTYNISFGGGIKRSFNENYREAKERLGVVTTLPIEASVKPVKKASKPAKRKKASSKADAKAKLEAVMGLITHFCRDHLNDEYLDLCRCLAEKLSRKRPSPLLRGKPATWACGIVRTIGYVNYLDDKSNSPSMKMTEIDEAFGVAQSTGQSKSKEIRDMFGIVPFDPDWWLPSRMDDNPIVWMIEVNGFPMDIRYCPRELQQEAFEQGLIPYIPVDREEKAKPEKPKSAFDECFEPLNEFLSDECHDDDNQTGPMKYPLPETPEQWLNEIYLAFEDAAESIPYGAAVGSPFTEAELFHLAPLVALKFRGRKTMGKEAEHVREIALANYIANSDPDGVDHALESRPLLGFTPTYVSSHLAMDLIDEQQATAIMVYCEEQIDEP